MPQDLVTVATFATPMEADMARNLLASASIEAFVADDATVGWLWHLGNALGGVKLQVAERDAERASAILASRPAAIAPEPPSPSIQHAIWAGWTCSRCGTQVNPRVTICPNCSTPVDDLEALSTAAADSHADEEEEITEMPGDVLASRALKAAIIGLLLGPWVFLVMHRLAWNPETEFLCLVLFPPLLHYYSIWLLGRLAFYRGAVSAASMRKIYATMAIDVFVLVVVQYVITGFFSA